MVERLTRNHIIRPFKKEQQKSTPKSAFLLLNDLPYYFVYFFSFQEIQEVGQ